MELTKLEQKLFSSDEATHLKNLLSIGAVRREACSYFFGTEEDTYAEQPKTLLELQDYVVKNLAVTIRKGELDDDNS